MYNLRKQKRDVCCTYNLLVHSEGEKKKRRGKKKKNEEKNVHTAFTDCGTDSDPKHAQRFDWSNLQW